MRCPLSTSYLDEINLSPTVNAVTVPCILEDWKVAISPILNLVSLRYAIPILVEFIISATIATPPSVDIISSPTVKSAVVPLGPDNEDNVIDGRSGSVISFDSYIPITLSTSGTFKQISLSSTLVPYRLLYVNPF